jgi:hypothetical protein
LWDMEYILEQIEISGISPSEDSFMVNSSPNRLCRVIKKEALFL